MDTPIKTIKNRAYGIDIIKVLAAFLVIIHHHLSSIGFYSMIFGRSNTLYILSMIQSITLTCVPLFLVCTGYLLSGRQITKKHYVKIIYFIAEVVLIYSIGTIIYMFLLGGLSIGESFVHLAEHLLAPTYYVNLYTTLFIFAPFLNKFYYSLEKLQRKIFVMLLITFISLIRLQNLIQNFVYFSGWPSASYPTLYYFIGVFIKDCQPDFSKKKLLILISFTSVFYSLFMRYYMNGRTFYYILGHYEGVFTMILTILIFLLLYNVEIKSKVLRYSLPLISSMSLCLYILGSTYTDKIALKFINISTVPLLNLPTFIYKVLLSTLFMIPALFLIYLIQVKIVNPLLKKFELICIDQ